MPLVDAGMPAMWRALCATCSLSCCCCCCRRCCCLPSLLLCMEHTPSACQPAALCPALHVNRAQTKQLIGTPSTCQPAALRLAPHFCPQMKQLIDTVLPFDATTFNIAKLKSGAA